jgi:hypothetical protein
MSEPVNPDVGKMTFQPEPLRTFVRIHLQKSFATHWTSATGRKISKEATLPATPIDTGNVKSLKKAPAPHVARGWESPELSVIVGFAGGVGVGVAVVVKMIGLSGYALSLMI